MPEHMLMANVEIITDGGRRRRWSAAEKLRIVEETLEDHACRLEVNLWKAAQRLAKAASGPCRNAQRDGQNGRRHQPGLIGVQRPDQSTTFPRMTSDGFSIPQAPDHAAPAGPVRNPSDSALPGTQGRNDSASLSPAIPPVSR